MFKPEKIVTLEFYRGLFEFFSFVFLSTPDKTMIDKIMNQEAFKDWPLKSHRSELKKALILLQNYCDTRESKQLTDMKIDYARLFLGLEKTLAPPYESVFLSEDHLIFEKETLAVRAFYERFGLQVPCRNEIPDDHLSYELQFIAAICDMLINALNKGDMPLSRSLVNDIRQFLDKHLMRWIDEFAIRVVTHADTDFYKGMAMLLAVSVGDFNEYLHHVS